MPKNKLQKIFGDSLDKPQKLYINGTVITCITLFSTFLWRPLHDYDVKPPNLTFYGGRGHTTTNFPSSFWTWIKSLRIQLQEKSPAFDILSGSKQTRLSLKEHKLIFFFFLTGAFHYRRRRPCLRSLMFHTVRIAIATVWILINFVTQLL